MIETLATIGKALIGEGPFEGDELLERLVQNPNAKGNCSKVFQLVFTQTNNDDEPAFVFKDIEVVDYDDIDRVRYLYRFGSPSGSDHSPSCRLTKAATSYPRKFIGAIKGAAKNKDLSKPYRTWFKALLKAAKDAAEEAVAGLDELSAGLDADDGALLTPIIERNGERLPPCELKPFREAFVRSVIESLSSPISGVDSSKTPGVCAVCLTDDRKVLGAVNPLRSFSVDKPGFAQGCERANAWRNFPCCLDCALALERGQEYVASRLNFYFYGFRLYLVPHFTGGRVEERLLEKIAEKLNEVVSDDYDPERLGFAGEKLQGFQRKADRLLVTAAKSEGVGAYDFIFYDIEQKAHRFLAVVPEVPREERLSKIFDTKANLDELAPFRVPRDKKGQRMFRFHFGLLRDKSGVLPKLGTHDPYGTDFLEIVQAVLGRGRIEWDWLLGHLMRHLREAFAEGGDSSLYFATRRDLMLLLFLTDPEISVVYHKGEPMAYKPENEKLQKLVDGEYRSIEEAAELAIEGMGGKQGLLSTPLKRAVFFSGVLAKRFLKYQHRVRGSAPFWKKLQGLRLSPEKITQLLPQIRVKYNAYDKEGKIRLGTKLERLVSEMWADAGATEDLSNNESSFLFTIGLNLGEFFKPVKRDDSEGEL
jgi:CRISPR-associated protein Csh1